MKITTVQVLIEAVVIKFQQRSLGVQVNEEAVGRREVQPDNFLARLHFIGVVVDGVEITEEGFVDQLGGLDLLAVLDVTVFFLIGDGLAVTRVADQFHGVIAWSGSRSPARRASEIASSNGWKHRFGVYSTT